MEEKKFYIKRGDILSVELKGEGSVHNGNKLVVVYSNNLNNIYAPTLNVIPLSSQLDNLIIHGIVQGAGLHLPTIVLPEQTCTINKSNIKRKVGKIFPDSMKVVDRCFDMQFGRVPIPKKKNVEKAV